MAAHTRSGDAVADAVADALQTILFGASVSISCGHRGRVRAMPNEPRGVVSATGPGPKGGTTTLTVTLNPRVARLLDAGAPALAELLDALPGAGLRAAAQLRAHFEPSSHVPVAMRRAVRDTVASEILRGYLQARLAGTPRDDIVAETIDYLIELSGSRVEAHDLTHGVVVTDALPDEPRLEFRYPGDLRDAKRAPLLFDGRRSVLVVDSFGRARTELQRHRVDRLGGRVTPDSEADGWLDSGSLVARATSVLGGLGFFVRADRSIWTFVDGMPLLVRRAEHWTAFPIELAASIANMIGGGPGADLVARAAFMISSRPQGAILAMVDSPADLEGVVPLKDRYDLRETIDPGAMRAETRLHHLIDVDPLDAETLARLAELDGATVLDREGKLLAYGAIVSSADSDYEGARTAAARTLSHHALVVLKVSVDGDITVFRAGDTVTTLLGRPGPERDEAGGSSEAT